MTGEPCQEAPWCDQPKDHLGDHQRYIGSWFGAHPGSNRPMTVQGMLIGNGQPHPELVIVDSENLLQTAVVLSWPVLEEFTGRWTEARRRFWVD